MSECLILDRLRLVSASTVQRALCSPLLCARTSASKGIEGGNVAGVGGMVGPKYRCCVLKKVQVLVTSGAVVVQARQRAGSTAGAYRMNAVASRAEVVVEQKQ